MKNVSEAADRIVFKNEYNSQSPQEQFERGLITAAEYDKKSKVVKKFVLTANSEEEDAIEDLDSFGKAAK